MLPFALTDEQTELAATVARWAHSVEARANGQAISLTPELWLQLADLGVLALGTEEGGGGCLEIAISLGELGRVGMPGPLVPTVLAAQVLASDHYDSVIAGDEFVGIGSLRGPVAWGAIAHKFLLVDGQHVALAEPLDGLAERRSLGGERWAIGGLRPVADATVQTRALAFADIALAAYLWGVGAESVRRAAAYAADRRQFGRPIGDFQGVAFPLAEAHAALEALQALTWSCAEQLDHGLAVEPLAASAAHVAVRAVCEACFAAHQVCGGMGFTVEGPMVALSCRAQDAAVLLDQRRRSDQIVSAVGDAT